MLETPFSFFISNKLGEIPIFGTVLAKKKSIFAYILLKIDIFRSAMLYYVILYKWKEETLPHAKSQGVVTTSSLWKACYKNGSGRLGLRKKYDN